MYVNEKIAEKCKCKGYPYSNADEICKLMAKENDTIMLSFSMGKVSIASWLFAKKHFKKIIPVYFYGIPNLEFIKKQVDYFENYFDTKIIQLPHPTLVDQLNYGLFMGINEIRIINRLQFPDVKYDSFFDLLREKYGEMYVAIGNRACDNVQRYTSFITHGAINRNRRTFWPVFDFTDSHVLQIIQENNVKLPIDYKMFGKTFDGMQERFLLPLKNEFPEDFERIKAIFPLVELELLRYERYIQK
jgi:3'-phosphoadenosine 5'-phosphosulfate sulfotransferase (PAPS reductase)/FAD synthetase